MELLAGDVGRAGDRAENQLAEGIKDAIDETARQRDRIRDVEIRATVGIRDKPPARITEQEVANVIDVAGCAAIDRPEVAGVVVAQQRTVRRSDVTANARHEVDCAKNDGRCRTNYCDIVDGIATASAAACQPETIDVVGPVGVRYQDGGVVDSGDGAEAWVRVVAHPED